MDHKSNLQASIVDGHTYDTPYANNFIENMKILADLMVWIIKGIIDKFFEENNDLTKLTNLVASEIHNKKLKLPRVIKMSIVNLFKCGLRSKEDIDNILSDPYKLLIQLLAGNVNLAQNSCLLTRDTKVKSESPINQLTKKNEYWYKEFLGDQYIPCREEYLSIICWFIFGCTTSTDIDILIFVNSLDFEKGIDFHILRMEVESVIGIMDRDIDYNFCYYNTDTHTFTFSKGCNDLTIAILLKTYELHPQKYELPDWIPRKVPIIKFDQLYGRCNKFILDKVFKIIDIHDLKQRKQDNYKVYGIEYIELVKEILKRIENNSDDSNWKNTIKSLMIKLVQSILAYDNIELEYTKPKLADVFESQYPNTYDIVMYAFMRGKIGSFDREIFNNICNRYCEILLDHYNNSKIEWLLLPQISLENNPSSLSDELFHMFIQSPTILTKEFLELLSTLKIQQFFESQNIESTKAFIPESLKEFTFFANQRSLEWFELLSTYTCGRNTAVTPERAKDPDWIYNLLRGSIVELMVINSDILEDIIDNFLQKITVGLLVESLEPGSQGCSPDLLIITNSGIIIPVEIKCMNQKPNIFNSHYRRSVDLATTQLRTAIDIINKHTGQISRNGIIIIVYVYIDDENKSHFDTYMANILL
jgi:hypothetical protein